MQNLPAEGRDTESPERSDALRRIERTAHRTVMCGRLRASDVGSEVRVVGWVHRRRNLGGLVFIDLRDRTGIVQCSFGPDWTGAESLERAPGIGHEEVISVEGTIEYRPEGQHNTDMPTGEVELRVTAVEVLNDAETPAIPVYRTPEEELPSEELRLRHRVLDLRRGELQANLMLRHRLILATRNVFDELGFVEVETPILTKPTPEGARDFLVPSREHPGEFFALPQSPQIYKQILMAAGFDRYVQIARCFRDEDLRADRQPEFTQIDVEASFIDPEDLMGWIETLMTRLSEEAGLGTPESFARMTHAEAMERYGVDRPDLRYGLEIEDFSEFFSTVDFNILRSALDAGGRVRCLVLDRGAELSRRQVDQIEDAAKKAGAPGLLRVKRTAEGVSGPLGKIVDVEALESLGLREGGLLLLAAGPDRITSPALHATRHAAIEALELPKEREHAWAWVLDFPLFEEDPATGALAPGHHPFVQPHPEDIDRLEEDPASLRSLAYDLVYNGSELGSGSIRIHRPELQRRVLSILGLNDDEIDRKFGFLLEALASGAPPHGGIALGMDRIVQNFAGAGSLRDVIAFPKTTAARALFEGAPTAVAASELADFGISLQGADTDD